MQRMAREDQFLGQLGRPARLDEFQVSIFARPVDFVTDDRKADMGEVHADLMRPPGQRTGAQQCHFALPADKAPLHVKFRLRSGTAPIDTAFQPDPRIAHFSLADDWRIDRLFVPIRNPAHDS